MKIGIVGLGLIGGSLAKAYRQAGAQVLGFDKDDLVTRFALMAGAIDDELADTNIGECDLIMIAITPMAAIQWFREHAPLISRDAVVIDCCGTKRAVCNACFPIAEEYGLTYMGGHPMAGKERGGIKNSSADLFQNAPFILVPWEAADMELLMRVKGMLMLAGFGRVGVTTSEEHDRVIAFTSQMPHIVSNGFIKSATALADSQMISAGSYQDFTRVAYLDEKMWSELFLENKDYLLEEISGLIGRLQEYQSAIDNDDKEKLEELLAEGKICKERVLKKCGPAQINGE
jgi:prephenate dehydrogenase